MKLAVLSRTTPPWTHLWATSADNIFTALRDWESKSLSKRVVRFIRGRKCTTKSQFFDETAAALQFPNYFGENWDAFNECFAELQSYGDKAAIVVAITDTDMLLVKESSREAGIFAEVVASALQCSNRAEKPSKPRPFHVVFQVTPQLESSTRKRWLAAGLSFA